MRCPKMACETAVLLLLLTGPCLLDASYAAAVWDQQSLYAEYAEALRNYVNDRGLVDYAAWKEHSETLDDFFLRLETLPVPVYRQWSANRKIAFWINVHNALAVKIVLKHYPLEARGLRGLFFPANSIRQIAGVWREEKQIVMGKPVGLDNIQHEILRRKFTEPRIHLALVCAALGSPPLRAEPYVGEKLEEQFNNQARRFFRNQKNFRIEMKSKHIYLSPLFKWYARDFVVRYTEGAASKHHPAAKRVLLNYLSRFLEADLMHRLKKENFEIYYLDFDWTLNGQETKDKEP